MSFKNTEIGHWSAIIQSNGLSMVQMTRVFIIRCDKLLPPQLGPRNEPHNHVEDALMDYEEGKTKKTRVKKVPHRIPYDSWINSQLSIARHFGGCKLNGKTYEMDRKCKAEANGKFKPDLVEVL